MNTRSRPLPRALTLLAAAIAATAFVPHAGADPPRLARLFSDGMVLQRDEPVRIWGWADPGARLSLRVGEFEVPARAGADGRWEALLPPFEAGGPWTLAVGPTVWHPGKRPHPE